MAWSCHYATGCFVAFLGDISTLKSGWNMKKNILMSSSRAFSLSTPTFSLSTPVVRLYGKKLQNATKRVAMFLHIGGTLCSKSLQYFVHTYILNLRHLSWQLQFKCIWFIIVQITEVCTIISMQFTNCYCRHIRSLWKIRFCNVNNYIHTM